MSDTQPMTQIETIKILLNTVTKLEKRVEQLENGKNRVPNKYAKEYARVEALKVNGSCFIKAENPPSLQSCIQGKINKNERIIRTMLVEDGVHFMKVSNGIAGAPVETDGEE